MKNSELLRKTILEVMADLERAELFTIRLGDCISWKLYYPNKIAKEFFKLPHNGKSKVL